MYKPLKRIEQYIEYVLVNRVSLQPSVGTFPYLTSRKLSTAKVRHQREGTRGQTFLKFKFSCTELAFEFRIQIFHHQSNPNEKYATST